MVYSTSLPWLSNIQYILALVVELTDFIALVPQPPLQQKLDGCTTRFVHVMEHPALLLQRRTTEKEAAIAPRDTTGGCRSKEIKIIVGTSQC